MKKWCLYCRTSTNRQEKGLEAQVRALESFAKQKGIKHYDIITDEGISGSKSSRPGLDNLMLGVRKGHYEGVIVYSFSRFARSTKHLLEALDEFRKRNISFISTSEAVDTNSALGFALFTIISVISQLERELISERVKNGLVNAAAKGKKLGRPKKRNSELILVLHKQGESIRSIAKLAKCSTWSVVQELKMLKGVENG